jgi:hypothetical protein
MHTDAQIQSSRLNGARPEEALSASPYPRDTQVETSASGRGPVTVEGNSPLPGMHSGTEFSPPSSQPRNTFLPNEPKPAQPTTPAPIPLTTSNMRAANSFCPNEPNNPLKTKPRPAGFRAEPAPQAAAQPPAPSSAEFPEAPGPAVRHILYERDYNRGSSAQPATRDGVVSFKANEA